MFRQVFPKVFAFESRTGGSNCFLLQGGKETALIDSSAGENREEILSGLSKIGISQKGVSLILHTHGHADHFGLDKEFPRARIAMHELDAGQIRKGNQKFACLQFFPNSEMPPVSAFLHDKQQIGLGGLKLQVVHTPGHTAGSICFLLASEKALFSGDTLFAKGFGRTDLPTGNAEQMMASLEKIKKISPNALLPGHGPLLLNPEKISESLESGLRTASTNAFL